MIDVESCTSTDTDTRAKKTREKYRARSRRLLPSTFAASSLLRLLPAARLLRTDADDGVRLGSVLRL